MNKIDFGILSRILDDDADLTRLTFQDMKHDLEHGYNPRDVAIVWMTRELAKQMEQWSREEIGKNVDEVVYEKGLQAMTEAKIQGLPFIFTIH